MQMSLLERVSQKVARSIPANPIRSKLTAPIASISFDDIPHSAARVGAPILQAANLRGTFYVCGNHTGQTFEDRPQHIKDDLIALHKAGHEIACHTFAHPDVRRLTPSQRQEDIEANQRFMRETLGDCALSSFAYPYGAVSLNAKMFYARHFFTCRGVYAGLNSGLMDFSELKAIGIESRQHDMGRVRALIDEAKASNGWLIFFTHDVGPDPSAFGCKPKDLEDVIGALQDAKVETMPVKAGAARAMFG
jgi:peptidoglycan/xylan/chitin deacetylase (PgdA/CDA1 family)